MTDERATPTWFVVHHDDAPWRGSAGHAYVDLVEVGGEGSFGQYGFSVDVLDPGCGNSYHYEAHEDESFLVLDGEFDLVVQGELHRVGAGEFVHCPAGTPHLFVGAGARPASIVMLGRRGIAPPGGFDGEYLPDPHAARFGLCVDAPTSDPDVAYAGRPPYGPVPVPRPWQLDRASRPAREMRRGSGGWYVVDVDAAGWIDNGRTARCIFDQYGELAQYGVNIQALRPGEASCRYHREFHFDESMLVLDGEAVLVAEGEERSVRAGDFVHLPAGQAHAFVGAGDRPCAILMVGTRDAALDGTDAWGEYVPDEAAARRGAAVARQTHEPEVAYADRPLFQPTAAPLWRWH